MPLLGVQLWLKCQDGGLEAALWGREGEAALAPVWDTELLHDAFPGSQCAEMPFILQLLKYSGVSFLRRENIASSV